MATPKPVINADDRLSSLPDDVVSHILSFLQTKYAVGTAVLSRRWEDLWTRVSNLDLDNGLIYQPRPGNAAFESSPPYEEQVKYLDARLPSLDVLERRLSEFSRFLDKVMSQHKNLDSLRQFRFHFSVGHDNPKLRRVFRFNKEWVFGPVLEEIDLAIEGDKGEVQFPLTIRRLPQSFYTLKNLRVVKLEGVLLRPAKGSVFLPSLKILQLRDVAILDCESLTSLLSGCPILETAHFEGCFLSYWKEQDILMVSLPSLKNFKMIRFGNHVKPLVVIGAPNLEELHLQEFGKLELMGSSPLACLHSAYIDIGEHRSPDLAGVLNRISNAKKMFLSGNTLSRMSVADNVQLPFFPKLTHLTIGIWGSSYTLFSLLNSASKLQYLVLDMVSPHVHLLVGMVEWLVLQHLPTPECLLSSLEEVEIKRLVVAEDTRKLLEYLLKAGTVLKKVNMHVDDDDDDGLDINFRENLVSLLNLPRGSSHCEVSCFTSQQRRDPLRF